MTDCAEKIFMREPEAFSAPARLAPKAVALATIRAARITLRAWTRHDLSVLVKLGTNYNVAKNLSTFPYPYTMADAEEWFDNTQTARGQHPDKIGGAWAIALDDQPIGGIGIHPDRMEHPELGYWLGEPFWHKGYATEAASALIAHAFTEWGLDQIDAGHYWDNHASGRVLTKLGFRYTLESRRFCKARGAEVRCLDMALTYVHWAGKATA
jgi:[ribosomal protein S5]-alanine N-acetyltransferase